MLAPLIILAVMAIVSGQPGIAEKLKVYDYAHQAAAHAPVTPGTAPAATAATPAAAEAHGPEAHGEDNTIGIISLAALALGVILALVTYLGRDKDPIRIRLFANKFYIDEIYLWIVRVFQDLVGHMCYAVDQLLVGAAFVTGSAKLTERAGLLLRRIQSGNLQAYGMIFALGFILLLALVLFR